MTGAIRSVFGIKSESPIDTEGAARAEEAERKKALRRGRRRNLTILSTNGDRAQAPSSQIKQTTTLGG